MNLNSGSRRSALTMMRSYLFIAGVSRIAASSTIVTSIPPRVFQERWTGTMPDRGSRDAALAAGEEQDVDAGRALLLGDAGAGAAAARERMARRSESAVRHGRASRRDGDSLRLAS